MTKKDKDIQRYTSGKCGGLPAVFDNGDVMKTKYVASLLNGIEAQANEIDNLKSHQKQLETGFDKQAKEIEQLKHLCIFSCGAWSDAHEWIVNNWNTENMGSYKMVQGTNFFIRLNAIGQCKYDRKKVGEAALNLINELSK